MIDITTLQTDLLKHVAESDAPREVLSDVRIKQLYEAIPGLEPSERADYGKRVNQLKQALLEAVSERETALENQTVTRIDVTAPFDVNATLPELLPTNQGTIHPLKRDIDKVIDIFTRMGFEAIEARQIDNEYNMFTSLNFPDGHPARDGYDTFRTEENYIPPAHTSVMQNQILRAGKEKLEKGENIAAISYGRVFRNEDVDPTHEHTFHQVEGVFVSKDANLAQLIGVLRNFFGKYYNQDLDLKTQPGYFPFTEPSLEFLIEKPAIIGGKPGEMLEMGGCGMIHPNVLKEAGIDSQEYRGFAWGFGIERMAMLAYGIEDIRHFQSGKLDFLRQF